ncbi:hypothetical protein [Aquabacterium sp.]|uniref:hypothetical protein n=1 Tax=Aquabacterium sp. TaxID=1872578 RepID=UPI0024873D26|nr:hypothetical protein [Aquabacterium sp.]MDI1259208.1 hypothetical protein [Aquabacterium sp.]
MLARLPDEILFDPARLKVLLHFIRSPYTSQSCELVEAHLSNQASEVYRRIGVVWETLKGGKHLGSLVGLVKDVLEPVTGLFNAAHPSLLLEQSALLFQQHVILLEELVRDALHESTESTGSVRALTNKEAVIAVRCLAVHDAIFLCLTGLYSVKSSRKELSFRLTNEGHAAMTQRLWATSLESNSLVSLHLSLKQVVDELGSSSRHGESIIEKIPGRLWHLLEALFLDKFFFIGHRAVVPPELSGAVRKARALCRWFVALEIVRIANEHVLRNSEECFLRIGLDEEILREIIDRQQKSRPQDKSVVINSDGDILMGNVALSHAMNMASDVALSSDDSRRLGEWFEEVYMLDYIRSTASEDYVVASGFKRPAENGAPKLDCDLIIFDKARGKFFFVQSKYKRESRFATIGDELRALTHKNSPLTSGVAQIAALRDRLGEQSVLDQVRGKFPKMGLTEERLRRDGHYVVVHTMPALNCIERNGVLLYEWAVFRNLLQRGVATKWHVNDSVASPERHVAKDILPLEDVNAILNHYIAATHIPKTQIDAEFASYANSGMGFTLPVRQRRLLWGSRDMKFSMPLL